MNICFVSTYDVECGIATYTEALTAELARAGHDVTVLAEKDPNKFEKSTHGNVKVFRTWYRHTFRGEEFAASILGAAVRPDVIHFQHEYGIFPNNVELLKAIINLSSHIPIFITLHTVQAPPHNTNFLKQLKDYANVIVHTPAAAALTDGITIPHGLHLRTEGVDKQDFFLVSGFMSPSKGHQEILEGYARYTCYNNCTTRLRIIGRCRDHNYLDKLNNDVIHYGLSHMVEIESKFVSDIALILLMRQSQAIILGANRTSPYSTSGQMHTAIGAGCTVIAKNVPIYNNLPVALYNTPEELSLLLRGHDSLHSSILPMIAESRTWEKVAQLHLAEYTETL